MQPTPVIADRRTRRSRPVAVAALLTAIAIVFAGASLRANAAPADTAAAYEAAMQTLAATTLDINVEDAPFATVINAVQKATGVNIVLDPRVRRDFTDEDLAVTLAVQGASAKQVLELCAASVNLGIGWRGGAVLVTWADDAEGTIPRAIAVLDITSLISRPRSSRAPYWQFQLVDRHRSTRRTSRMTTRQSASKTSSTSSRTPSRSTPGMTATASTTPSTR
jgi:hypothetical protein